MNNRIISIQSEGRKSFDLAFKLMFDRDFGDMKATHYFKHPTKGFILLWHEESFGEVKAIKLPFAMDWQIAANLVWGWLLEREDKEYQEYLDHDGSNGHGFRVYNENWGHVAGSHYAILAVLPVWAWYGK